MGSPLMTSEVSPLRSNDRAFREGQNVWWNSSGNAAHPAGRFPAIVVRYSTSGKRVYILYAPDAGPPCHVFVSQNRLEPRCAS